MNIFISWTEPLFCLTVVNDNRSKIIDSSFMTQPKLFQVRLSKISVSAKNWNSALQPHNSDVHRSFFCQDEMESEINDVFGLRFHIGWPWPCSMILSLQKMSWRWNMDCYQVIRKRWSEFWRTGRMDLQRYEKDRISDKQQIFGALFQFVTLFLLWLGLKKGKIEQKQWRKYNLFKRYHSRFFGGETHMTLFGFDWGGG